MAYDPMYGGFGQEPKFPTPMPSPFCFAIITGQGNESLGNGHPYAPANSTKWNL